MERKSYLLCIAEGFARWILVGFTVVDLERGEHGVIETHVNADDVVNNCMIFVRFQWGRDGEIGSGIAVENVNEFGFFDG